MSVTLHGVFAPVLLALDQSQEIDEPALRREARALLEAGIHGLIVNGATSEGAMVTDREAGEVCRIVAETAAGRVPVVAGVIADSTRQAVRLASIARDSGASALLVPPVHFLNLPPREGVIGFYRTISEEVGLPIVIYNVVPLLNLSPERCLELAELEGVVAVKQSNERFHELADLLHLAGDRLAVFTALEDLIFPSLVLGVAGMMVSIATLLPELCVELLAAVERQDLVAARALHRRIFPVVRATYVDENFPATLKAALALRGRPVGPPRSPLVPVGSETLETIRRSLVAAGALRES